MEIIYIYIHSQGWIFYTKWSTTHLIFNIIHDKLHEIILTRIGWCLLQPVICNIRPRFKHRYSIRCSDSRNKLDHWRNLSSTPSALNRLPPKINRSIIIIIIIFLEKRKRFTITSSLPRVMKRVNIFFRIEKKKRNFFNDLRHARRAWARGRAESNRCRVEASIDRRRGGRGRRNARGSRRGMPERNRWKLGQSVNWK